MLAVLAGCLLLVVAALYFAEPAHSLPAFFPGHVGAGDAEAPTTTSSTASPPSPSRSRRSPTPGFRPARRHATKSPEPGVGHQLPPGGDPRAAPGHRRALPGLLAGPWRDPAAPARLGHPPERRLLPRLPGRDAPGDRARALRLLLRGLEAHRHRHRAVAARARGPRRRRRRPPGLAARGRHDPRRAHRPAGREAPAQRVRVAGQRGDLPVRQRDHAARRRAPAAPRGGHRQRRLRRAPGPAELAQRRARRHLPGDRARSRASRAPAQR